MPFILSRLRAYDVSFACGVVFFLSLAILLCTYGRMYILDGDYPRAQGVYHLIKDECVDGKRLITGDSVARDGIDPRILGDDVLNISLGASGPIELYFELKDMRECQFPPKKVYLGITPHHFMGDDGFWYGSIRFGLISREEMGEVRENSRLLSNDIVYKQGKISLDQKISYWLKEHRAPTLYFPSIRNTLIHFRHADSVSAYNRIIANQGYLANKPAFAEPDYPNKPVPTRLAPEAREKNFVPNPLASLYFEKILQLLKDQHVDVVLFNMPISDVSKSAMSPDYLNGYGSFINAVLARHPEVHFVGEMMPTFPIRYYNDESHLNDRGGYEWTLKIKPLLNGAP